MAALSALILLPLRLLAVATGAAGPFAAAADTAPDVAARAAGVFVVVALAGLWAPKPGRGVR